MMKPEPRDWTRRGRLSRSLKFLKNSSNGVPCGACGCCCWSGRRLRVCDVEMFTTVGSRRSAKSAKPVEPASTFAGTVTGNCGLEGSFGAVAAGAGAAGAAPAKASAAQGRAAIARTGRIMPSRNGRLRPGRDERAFDIEHILYGSRGGGRHLPDQHYVANSGGLKEP